MRRFLLAALVLGLVPMATAQNTDPSIDQATISASSIDLIADSGTTLTIDVETSDNDIGDRVEAVELVFSGPTSFVLNPFAVDSGKTEWQASLGVDDVRLEQGTYSVTIKAFDRQGGTDTRVYDSMLTVRIDDLSLHALHLGVHDVEIVGNEAPLQNLGRNSGLRVDASVQGAAMLLKEITYHTEVGGVAGGTATLARPYYIPDARFVEGDQDLVLTLADRGGRTKSLTVPIYKDTVAPAVTVSQPATTYQGVPFDFSIHVEDKSDYTVQIILDEQASEQIPGESNPLTISLERDLLGKTAYVVAVVDALGNAAIVNGNVTTEQAIADTTVKVEVLDAFPLPGTPVKFDVTTSQDGGVADIPANLILWIPGHATLFNEEVIIPIDGRVEQQVLANLRPGTYEINATVQVADLINETDDSDQTHLVSFEVFTGKVVHGEDEYYIRVSNLGYATHAISTTGAQYKLTLNQTSGKAVYEFDVKGVRLHWDPASIGRTTTISVEQAVEPKEDNNIPGFPLALLLGALLVAARRK